MFQSQQPFHSLCISGTKEHITSKNNTRMEKIIGLFHEKYQDTVENTERGSLDETLMVTNIERKRIFIIMTILKIK